MRTLKRSHSSSESDGNIAKRETKRIRIIDKREPNPRRMRDEAAHWKKLYKLQNKKFNEREKFYKKQFDMFSKVEEQLNDLTVDGDVAMTKINQAVINSVTMTQFNQIRALIEEGKLSRVLSNRKHIEALRRLFLGLTYGVIPITQPQRIALSEDERTMVKTLENATVDKVKTYIKRNESSFLRLFDIINDSLKLITRTYERYGFS